jgi:type II secretory pathway pseudopilin PulG
VKRKWGDRDGSRGELLIEVLIALAILGIISVVFIGAMYTSLNAARITDERSNALTLAKSQIEYVRTAGYSTIDNWAYTVDTSGSSYSVMPSWWSASPPPTLASEYTGYSVAVTGTRNIDLDGTTGPDEGIRTITAVVSHNGTAVFTLENYEVDR